jgi:hypothetical protein
MSNVRPGSPPVFWTRDGGKTYVACGSTDARPAHGPNPDKAARKARRQHNRRKSLARLDEAGITYTIEPRGLLVVIEGPDGPVDFYPGTGAWYVRTVRTEGRGVFGLMGYLRGKDRS